MAASRFHLAPCGFLAALLVCLAVGTAAAESLRDREIRECQPGEIITWEDGTDRPAINSSLTFAYDAAGAPAWFPPALVMDLLARAAAAWSECGIQASAVAWGPAVANVPGLVRVRWSEQGSGGNFGLADIGHSTLSLGPKAFELLRTRNPTHDASTTLQMTLSHEMGHLFGLMAHSRRCVDVLSYYHNARGEKCFARDAEYAARGIDYRDVLPTACDIARCRIANRLRPVPPRTAAPGAQD
ncbi:MAG: hypothetical protein ACM3Y9_14920 [Ignavibacteria bacterium]